MTQDEMEAEIKGLRGQVLQLQQQQDAQKKVLGSVRTHRNVDRPCAANYQRRRWSHATTRTRYFRVCGNAAHYPWLCICACRKAADGHNLVWVKVGL